MLRNKRIVRMAAETVKGTGVDPDAACLAFDVETAPTAEWIQRSGSGLYLGNAIPGTAGDVTGSMSFKVELRTTGSAALDPAVLLILQASGFSSAPALVSDIASQTTLTIEVNEDGLLKQLTGCMCELKITGEQGKQVFLEVTAHGKWVTPVAEAMGDWSPGATVPGKLGSGSFTFDSVAMINNSFEIDLGNTLAWRNNHNAISNRDVTLTMDPEASTTHLAYTKWLAGTEMAFSLSIVDAGGTITIAAPKVQYKEIGDGERNGIDVNEVTGQCNISSGNDELSISVS